MIHLNSYISLILSFLAQKQSTSSGAKTSAPTTSKENVYDDIDDDDDDNSAMAARGSGKKAAAMDDRGKSAWKGKAVDLDYYDSGENDASDTEDINDNEGSMGDDEYIEEEEEDYDIPTDILRRSVRISSFCLLHKLTGPQVPTWATPATQGTCFPTSYARTKQGLPPLSDSDEDLAYAAKHGLASYARKVSLVRSFTQLIDTLAYCQCRSGARPAAALGKVKRAVRKYVYQPCEMSWILT